MNEHPVSYDISLEPIDNKRLANLCGQFNEHITQVESYFGVEINSRGNHFQIIGDQGSSKRVTSLLQSLYDDTERHHLTPERVSLFLQQSQSEEEEPQEGIKEEIVIKTRRVVVKGRSPGQKRFLEAVNHNDVNFAVGPAGTGKTYLAVASAVQALETEQVRRLVLVRPAVEAGERLGFLPGDMTQKIDPYLRPLYDALYEMLGFEKVAKLIDRNIIEVAPLAFMRGRSLNEAYIILDEAQNTTIEQMKMFLTRIGFGSTAVIAGDVSQVDLPRGVQSGLRHVVEVLRNVEGISFTFFKSKEVVRHPLIQRIVDAYEADQKNQDSIGSKK